MPIVGGLDIHRKQITFDYLDTATAASADRATPASAAHPQRHPCLAMATTGGLLHRPARQRRPGRAVAVMERIDFSPTGLRKDLAGARSAPSYLYSAAELINHAADLSAASSVLTHENGRRWRIFRERVEQITLPASSP